MIDIYWKKEADVRKQKASLAESCELAKKVKTELEKRLDETQQEKSRIEANYQEKLNELEALKTENDRVHAEQASLSQVCTENPQISIYYLLFVN